MTKMTTGILVAVVASITAPAVAHHLWGTIECYATQSMLCKAKTTSGGFTPINYEWWEEPDNYGYWEDEDTSVMFNDFHCSIHGINNTVDLYSVVTGSSHLAGHGCHDCLWNPY
jgi:hypothetical protein